MEATAAAIQNQIRIVAFRQHSAKTSIKRFHFVCLTIQFMTIAKIWEHTHTHKSSNSTPKKENQSVLQESK